MTRQLLPALALAAFPLIGCTVNLGNDVGSDGESESSGDGDGDVSGDGDGDTQSCPDGTLDCPCYGNNTCNAGLECIDGVCEPAAGDGDGDGDGDTMGDGDGDGDTMGDGDGDATGDGDGETGDGDGETGDGDGDGDGDVVDLADWTKKRDIIIENQLQTPLDDYQTLLVIDYDDDMQIDFEDLRFTNEADDTLLPFWVETATVLVEAKVFVRIPHLPDGDITTIHMYYGNPNATSASDGPATFDFFDDFEGPNLDDVKWTATGIHSLEFGYLAIESGAIYTNDFAFEDFGRIEMRARWHQGDPSDSGLMIGRGQGYMGNLGRLSLTFFGNMYAAADEGGNMLFNVSIGLASQDNWYDPSIVVADGQLVYYRHRLSNGNVFDVDYPGSFFVALGHPYGKDAQQQNIIDVDIDWVLRRGYASVEPNYVFGGEQNI
jgi:hypothetical protein